MGGIEYRQIIRAELERSVDQALRIDRRVPAVRGNLIVKVDLRIRPIPLGDDDVALDALWPRRRRRHLTRGNAVRPVGEQRERAVAADLAERLRHARPCLAGLNPALPRSG